MVNSEGSKPNPPLSLFARCRVTPTEPSLGCIIRLIGTFVPTPPRSNDSPTLDHWCILGHFHLGLDRRFSLYFTPAAV